MIIEIPDHDVEVLESLVRHRMARLIGNSPGAIFRKHVGAVDSREYKVLEALTRQINDGGTDKFRRPG